MTKTRSHISLFALVVLLLLLFGSGAPTFAAAPGDVVINEIMQNPSAVFDSAGEWLELYNATSSDIDINGWTIGDNDIDSHVIDNGGPLIVPAGGYLVLGNNDDTATNGGVSVDYSYGSNWFLANGADEVVLLDGDGVEIDRVEYDGGFSFPDPNGASMALSDPGLDNNVGANWCTASTPYGAGDLGTPGAENDCGGGSGASDPVINEFSANTTGTDVEYVEIYGEPDADYSSYTVLEIEGDG
ncbi:MAG TPA: lamin tail domain-containing protein, partial [Candidatus Binatia bacterium]|nr:lamin tail domain-containing protein [Candidatus Binatia bacterium]